MKSYIVYNNKSGEIIRTGQCQDDALSIQAVSDDESVIESNSGINSSTGYILNGEAVSYTDEQRSNKQQLPSYPAIWSNETFSWVDLRTPDQIRTSLINAVTLKRNKLLADSDWTDTLSAKTRLGDERYNAWQVYRQVLRDIPLQPGFPFEVLWPIAPQ